MTLIVKRKTNETGFGSSPPVALGVTFAAAALVEFAFPAVAGKQRFE
jgi:hypothetical protein